MRSCWTCCYDSVKSVPVISVIPSWEKGATMTTFIWDPGRRIARLARTATCRERVWQRSWTWVRRRCRGTLTIQTRFLGVSALWAARNDSGERYCPRSAVSGGCRCRENGALQELGESGAEVVYVKDIVDQVAVNSSLSLALRACTSRENDEQR